MRKLTDLAEIAGYVNEDGTVYKCPDRTLYDKWRKKFPPLREGKPCTPVLYYSTGCGMNYLCLSCREMNCMYNMNWKVPEEDVKAAEELVRIEDEYMALHNPNLYAASVAQH